MLSRTAGVSVCRRAPLYDEDADDEDEDEYLFDGNLTISGGGGGAREGGERREAKEEEEKKREKGRQATMVSECHTASPASDYDSEPPSRGTQLQPARRKR